MNKQMSLAVKPDVVERSSLKVVGTYCKTMMDERFVKVPRLMEKFHTTKLPKIKNRIHAPTSIGMFVDPPNWKEESDPFYWIAAVEVDSFEKVPPDMITKTIPKQMYAMLEYDPDQCGELEPYPYLHAWIREQGYKQVEGFGFEEYHPYTGPNTKFTLYLPIE